MKNGQNHDKSRSAKKTLIRIALLALLAPALLLHACNVSVEPDHEQNTSGTGETTAQPQETEAPAPALPPAEEMVVTSDDNYNNTAPLT
ncbi:MAG: hypothetical protein J6Y21_00930, partial [Clostridia bacterium]|nr:hypothetical protein [Clostridia bacterium]